MKNREAGADSEAEGLQEMELFDHLIELRRRLLYSFLFVAFFSVFGFQYSRELFELLNRPFALAFEGHELIGTGPAEAFILRLKLAVFAGVVLAMPTLLYQVWAFVVPGLYEEERKGLIPFLVASTLLFSIGIGFCYYAVLPFAYDFFLQQYQAISTTPMLKVSEHLALSIKAMLGFGFVFEMPVLAYFLGRAGVLRSEMMVSAFRYAIVVIFLASAILTPPDVLTQFLMAGPMLILYGLSLLIVRSVEKARSGESN